MRLVLQFDEGEPEVTIHRAEVRWGNASVLVRLDGRYYRAGQRWSG